MLGVAQKLTMYIARTCFHHDGTSAIFNNYQAPVILTLAFGSHFALISGTLGLPHFGPPGLRAVRRARCDTGAVILPQPGPGTLVRDEPWEAFPEPQVPPRR